MPHLQGELVVSLFVLTGVLSPMLISLLQLEGACEPSTLLFVLPNYVGMSLTLFVTKHDWFMPKRVKQEEMRVEEVAEVEEAEEDGEAPHVPWRHVLILCILDVISAGLNFTGLVYAGSAIFTVAYSSVTMYTAVFSRLILGRELLYVQWIGLWVVVLGLSITSLVVPAGSVAGPVAHQPDESELESLTGVLTSTDDSHVSLGIFMIVTGSLFHALCYILSEVILVKIKNPIAPELLSTIMGGFGFIVFGIWQIVYTLPRADELVVQQIKAHNGSSSVIIGAYGSLIVCNLVHAICFFHLLTFAGSTTTGILKGVQSVMVFVLSHFAFCSLSKSQCFSAGKATSLVLVVFGVFLYSNYKKDDEESKEQRYAAVVSASSIEMYEEGTIEGGGRDIQVAVRKVNQNQVSTSYYQKEAK